jgi:hypothetical protein
MSAIVDDKGPLSNELRVEEGPKKEKTARDVQMSSDAISREAKGRASNTHDLHLVLSLGGHRSAL